MDQKDRDAGSRSNDGTQPSEKHRYLLLQARYSLERARENDREFRRLVNRRTKKLDYRRGRKSAGLPVRENRDLSKLPRDPGESEDDFQRRIRREAARARRGVTAQTVRCYTKLSELSDHERQEHKSKRARERKRKERERKKLNQSVTPPAAE